ncbi:HlyD family type I secretion periplasmic adaptor subunit [Delftia sp. PS-11]|uniref:HlyD family type I secretion periplasmic adaptor subunit n=1 Tax=Delftia sp. PS-11 TaxID=2767222 RepID=UPI002454DF2A|nr:HlyD family type I secretion periplasmic adaptor subunit [Delftia sp. PS-11]KAJ8745975.1 HlyD family type I secretion periplasmic adaptor subunit [Delftia sp. PS-11]
MADSLNNADKKTQLVLDEKALMPFDAPASRSSDLGRAGRWGLWALGLGFGGFLLWAALAPLDEGVPGPGNVALDTKRKAVQHLSGGIVQEVMVREGDEVKEGQVLIKLDSATVRANYESARQNYLALLAMQGRLQAEQLGKASITWHPDLKAAAADPQIQQQLMNQEQLFNTRKSLLRSDLQSLEESIQGQEGMLQSYASMLVSRKNQLSLLNEELTNLRGLVEQGYAPRNRQRELERMVADLNASMADLQGNTLRARSSIAELRSRSVSRKQEYRKEVESQLADASRQVLAEGERFRALTNDLSRTEIRSPASGQVVGLVSQTVGGVVQPGQKLMDIVPEGAQLMLEARVAPHMIDRVKAEMPVDVRFSSFANTPQLVVQGQVESVSGDLITDAQGQNAYYLARVKVTEDGVKKLGSRQLHPGMPVEVIFKGGERSVLTYLLHPLTKRIAASMTEE